MVELGRTLSTVRGSYAHRSAYSMTMLVALRRWSSGLEGFEELAPLQLPMSWTKNVFVEGDYLSHVAVYLYSREAPH